MKGKFRILIAVVLLVLSSGWLARADARTSQPSQTASGMTGAAQLYQAAPSEAKRFGLRLAPAAQGSTGTIIIVNTTADELNQDGDCALREAIQAANTGRAVDACPAGRGTVLIRLPAGNYTLALPGRNEEFNLTGDLDIRDDLAIQGDGAALTVIDANHLDRALHIHPGRVVEIESLAIVNGHIRNANGGGIYNAAATLTLNRVTLSQNRVNGRSGTWYGGGLCSQAMFGQDATATLNHCRVTGNRATSGAGVANLSGDGSATMTVNRCTIRANSAQVAGGGAANAHTISPVSPAPQPSLMRIVDSTIRDNSVTARGPAAGYGGGVAATGQRGAINALTLSGSTVNGNIASGTYAQSGIGGGLFLSNGTATLVNNTISGNWARGNELGEASGLGGGIAVFGGSVVTSLALRSTTIAANMALTGGGIANIRHGAEAQVVFKNTIVAGNVGPFDTASCANLDLGYGRGNLISLDHNMEDRDSCNFHEPHDWTRTNPMLGPLQDNGGDTATHALLEGSPAIDACDDANCPCVDQRGVPRPQGGHCDIGSYEAPDTIPPQVAAVYPPDGATSIYLNAALVITFSEPIDVDTFALSSITPDPGGWVVSWRNDDRVVSLQHNPFACDMRYVMAVTGAQDRAGNPLPVDFAWSFTTLTCDSPDEVEAPSRLNLPLERGE